MITLSRTRHWSLGRTPPQSKMASRRIRFGSRKVEEFYDNSVIRELVNEGFVEKVSKKSK